MFWGWIGFYVLSIILLGKTLQLYLKKKNDWRIDMELTINDLSKEYGRKKTVNHFSVKLTNGVYGLLGANGAGKTTLMRMICDVQTETKGAIFLTGKHS